MPDAHTKGRSAAASSRTAHPFVHIRFMCARKVDDAGFDRGAEICYNVMLPFQKGGAGGMRFTDVLWDFNGTLLDDADAGLACVEELLRRRGLPPLGGIAHYREVFRFPIRDYYADIGFDFAREDYGALADEWALLYGELAADAPLREGVPEALERLRRAGVRLTVLSASERGMLCRQLRQRGVYELFDEVLGLDDFRAQDKLGIAREWRGADGSGAHPDGRRHRPRRAGGAGDRRRLCAADRRPPIARGTAAHGLFRIGRAIRSGRVRFTKRK